MKELSSDNPGKASIADAIDDMVFAFLVHGRYSSVPPDRYTSVQAIKERFHETGQITEGEYAEAYVLPEPIVAFVAPELETENAQRHGTLAYANEDEKMAVYRWMGVNYVVEIDV